MSVQSPLALRDAVRSVVTGTAFDLVETATPFDFDRVPAQLATDSVRVETRQAEVVGGFAFSETVTDDVDIWVARLVTEADAGETYRTLQDVARSLTSAVIRDGALTNDYAVDDRGRRADLAQPAGSAFQVLRLTLPCSYVLTV